MGMRQRRATHGFDGDEFGDGRDVGQLLLGGQVEQRQAVHGPQLRQVGEERNVWVAHVRTKVALRQCGPRKE